MYTIGRRDCGFAAENLVLGRWELVPQIYVFLYCKPNLFSHVYDHKLRFVGESFGKLSLDSAKNASFGVCTFHFWRRHCPHVIL